MYESATTRRDLVVAKQNLDEAQKQKAALKESLQKKPEIENFDEGNYIFAAMNDSARTREQVAKAEQQFERAVKRFNASNQMYR